MKSMYVSMPMKDKGTEEIIQEFKRLKEKYKDYDQIDSLVNIEMMGDSKHLSVRCLAESIKHLSKADVVLFAKGWEDARGCKIEHEIAKQYGIEIMYEV